MNFKFWLESDYPRTAEEELEIAEVLKKPISSSILEDTYNFMKILIKFPLRSQIFVIPRKNDHFYRNKVISKKIKEPVKLFKFLNNLVKKNEAIISK